MDIDFSTFEERYQVPADEFNVDYSTVAVINEADVRQMRKMSRMGDNGESFAALEVPEGSAQVEFEWIYEDYHHARIIARQEAMNMTEFANFVAAEPDFAKGTMRYFFALPDGA